MANLNINNNLASETGKGIVEEATQAEVNAGTDTGATGARLFAVPSKIIAYVSGTYATLAALAAHIANTSNPHSVTKSQVGLGSVVNADTTTTANITDSSNKRFVTDAQLTVIGNTSGTNTGDQDLSSYATKAGTETLTNKRITARTSTEASSATPTINTDSVDFHSVTALATNITSFTTNLSGTPTEAQVLWIAITDNGTARSIAWGSSFESSGQIFLPTTTVISTRLDVAFIWNTVTSKWRCIGVA